MNHYFHSTIRQRLIDARKEARRTIPFIEERKEAKQSHRGIVLIEKNDENAILRYATDVQSAGAIRMAIPFKGGCVYTSTNGNIYFTYEVELSAWF